MAYSVNKAILIGNLGRDPELRYTQTGKAVANVSLATTSKSGGEDRTEWHNLVFWEQSAEIINKHAQKGSKLYVEGRIQTREYDDRDGNKRKSTEINVSEFVIIDGRNQQQDRGQGGGQQQRQQPNGGQQSKGGGQSNEKKESGGLF